MKELKTVEISVEYVHNVGSTYYLADYDDDMLYVHYVEIDKNGFGFGHKVLIAEKSDWDVLCGLYPYQRRKNISLK